MYVCTNMYVRIYVCMYVCTYVRMYVCMYVSMYVRKYVCMSACGVCGDTVGALRYKPYGRGFDSIWGYWDFSIT